MANKSPRRARVAEQIRRELADLLLREVKHPAIGSISLTAVELSADFAHAKVYFVALAGDGALPDIEAALARTSGFLRRELAHRLSIHTTPQLQFVYDQSVERGAALSRLIDEAVASDQARKPS